MSEKSLDEQFAEIVAHWHEEALGADPLGDERSTPPDPQGPDHQGPGAQGHDQGPDHQGPGAHGADPQGADPQGPDPQGLRPERPAPHASAPPTRVPAPGWRSQEPAEVEDHFEPAPLAPLPSGDDKHFWGIILGLVGGPLLLLFLVLFDRGGSGWWKLFALVLSATGFVLLVLRQPTHREDDDDGVRL